MPHVEHVLGWPSVTSVLSVVNKPFLVGWAAKLGTKKAKEVCRAFSVSENRVLEVLGADFFDDHETVKKQAGDLGTHVHDAIESLLTGHEVPPFLSTREREMVNTFAKWRDQSGFIPIVTELHVESKKYEFHGTLDCIGHFGDENSLFCLDWKSSSQIDALYGVQLSAYAQAYLEETGKQVVGGGIIRLEKKADKKPQIEVKQFDDLPKYFDVFLACLDVWDFVNNKGKWSKTKRGKKVA